MPGALGVDMVQWVTYHTYYVVVWTDGDGRTHEGMAFHGVPRDQVEWIVEMAMERDPSRSLRIEERREPDGE